MIVSNVVARTPYEVMLVGGAAAGLGASSVTAAAARRLGATDEQSTFAATAAGPGLAFGAIMVDPTVSRMKNREISRFVVQGDESIQRSMIELRWGRAGSRVMAGIAGAGIGVLLTASRLMMSMDDPAPAG